MNFIKGENMMYKYISILFIFVLFVSCEKNNKLEGDLQSITIENEIQKLNNKRIYFGHQSVGGNIIDGLTELVEPYKFFNIIDMNQEQPLPESYFLHSKIGKNEDPGSKCDDFTVKLDRIDGQVDIAMLKFCYIDINRDTDIQSLFQKYHSTMAELINKYPRIEFMHITVPLTHSESGLGVTLRELLGRENKSKLDNIRRNEYNELLRNTFEKDKIFDLARAESTYPDGSRNLFKWDSKKYEHLIGEYASDGRHLNEKGSRWVASEMIKALSGVSDK
jgi:hypothetical protein